MPRPASLPLRLSASLLGLVLAAGALVAVESLDAAATGAPVAAKVKSKKAKRDGIVTPGNFTGYGFDQCVAPTQAKMDRWLQYSPFMAVGIYISGDQRACRDQPNLTPAWVSTQLSKGWRLLPITLGPQAKCQPRFPRYGGADIDTTLAADGVYRNAYNQGVAEASSAVTTASSLGIVAGSTLWYDLEGFSYGNTRCRESALSFLSGWTQQLHALGYVSGVYSSAGSGIKALDEVRVSRPTAYALPDQIWIARWDGVANTSVNPMYMRADGWPKARVKQYQGGHNETWGNVKINIDRNYLDLGTGSVAVPETHCGGIAVGFSSYPTLYAASSGRTSNAKKVQALQCLLQEAGAYAGPVDGVFSDALVQAANGWQRAHNLAVQPAWSRNAWLTLLSAGSFPVLKYGSAGLEVRRLQRALKSTTSSPEQKALRQTGVFDARTEAALRAYQTRLGLNVCGVANTQTWSSLQAGIR
jgi:glycoside hydrolase-like protein/putative peptidoglycan binding protein